jgi:hypothetical protein
MTKNALITKIAALYQVAQAMVKNGTAQTNYQTGNTIGAAAQVSQRLGRGILETRAKYQLESLQDALDYFIAYWIEQLYMSAISEEADRQLERKAPIDVCNIDQLQESRNALAGCVEKWGAMAEALEAGRMDSVGFIRFVLDEKVYMHGELIDGDDGKPTTRIAQLANRGEHRGQEFRSLVLAELKATVAACQEGLPRIDEKLEELRQNTPLEQGDPVEYLFTNMDGDTWQNATFEYQNSLAWLLLDDDGQLRDYLKDRVEVRRAKPAPHLKMEDRNQKEQERLAAIESDHYKDLHESGVL